MIKIKLAVANNSRVNTMLASSSFIIVVSTCFITQSLCYPKPCENETLNACCIQEKCECSEKCLLYSESCSTDIDCSGNVLTTVTLDCIGQECLKECKDNGIPGHCCTYDGTCACHSFCFINLTTACDCVTPHPNVSIGQYLFMMIVLIFVCSCSGYVCCCLYKLAKSGHRRVVNRHSVVVSNNRPNETAEPEALTPDTELSLLSHNPPPSYEEAIKLPRMVDVAIV